MELAPPVLSGAPASSLRPRSARLANPFLSGCCPRGVSSKSATAPALPLGSGPAGAGAGAARPQRHRAGECRAILFEPPQFELNEKEKERDRPLPGAPPQPREVGTGHGVLYDTPQRGTPAPFGAVVRPGGVNFAVQSSAATALSLCLFTPEDLARGRPSAEVPLDPVLNRTGNVWHAFLPGLSAGLLYGYRVAGPMAPEEGLRFDAANILVDPYAKVPGSPG